MSIWVERIECVEGEGGGRGGGNKWDDGMVVGFIFIWSMVGMGIR